MSFESPHIKDIVKYFCFSVSHSSIWQSLGTSIFCTSLLLSVSILFPHLLSRPPTWGKAKLLLGHSLGQLHNQPRTAAASVDLSLPFSPPSVPPVCFWTWPSVLLPQSLCMWSPPNLEALPPVAAWFVPSSSGVFKYHRADFPRFLSLPIKVSCLHLPRHSPLSSSSASSSPRALLPVGSLSFTPS